MQTGKKTEKNREDSRAMAKDIRGLLNLALCRSVGLDTKLCGRVEVRRRGAGVVERIERLRVGCMRAGKKSEGDEGDEGRLEGGHCKSC